MIITILRERGNQKHIVTRVTKGEIGNNRDVNNYLRGNSEALRDMQNYPEEKRGK